MTAVCMHLKETMPPVADDTTTTRVAWANHGEAFFTSDLDKIMLDYTEDSQIITYDMLSGRQDVFRGLAGIREAFVGLFAELSDLSDLAAPVIRVQDETNTQPQVFLMWSCAASGFNDVTDTFAFNADGKIIKQNVVFWRQTPLARNDPVTDLNQAAPETPVQAGWDNHFEIGRAHV